MKYPLTEKHCIYCGKLFTAGKRLYCERTCQQASIEYRLENTLKGHVRRGFKDVKVPSIKELIGCSIQQLMHYLEKQFQFGMTWDNYGKWQVDHIKPLNSFDLSLSEQRQLVSHYTNLRPLWAKENALRNAGGL